MLFQTPKTTPQLQKQLDELEELRKQLLYTTEQPFRWIGTLRRLLRASSVESSIAIEGFHLQPGEALSLSNDKLDSSLQSDSQQALICYTRAMEHVSTMARDPHFHWVDRVILDLHFDACQFQTNHSPGLWRTQTIGVTDKDGGLAYKGPAPEKVPELMIKVCDWLQRGEETEHAVIRAAMAHLHLVSIHPFCDGNGRIARIIQSLVLVREGSLPAELSSIEEYLGEHTARYYSTLQKVQDGSYQPERDATPWLEFCIQAHIGQAKSRIRQVEVAGQRWARLEQLVQQQGWPDRLVIPLEQSLFEGTSRAAYAKEADISLPTASNDLRRLLDAGLINTTGKGRNTSYQASNTLFTLVKEFAPTGTNRGD